MLFGVFMLGSGNVLESIPVGILYYFMTLTCNGSWEEEYKTVQAANFKAFQLD